MEQSKPIEKNLSVEKGNDVEGRSLSLEVQVQIQESVARDVQDFFERNFQMVLDLKSNAEGHAQHLRGITEENYSEVHDAYKQEFVKQFMASFTQRFEKK